MGVTEDKKKRRLKDKNRLDSIIARQLEIERTLQEDTGNLVSLYTEKRNLIIERDNLERKLDIKE